MNEISFIIKKSHKQEKEGFILTGSLMFSLPTTKSGHLKINTTQYRNF